MNNEEKVNTLTGAMKEVVRYENKPVSERLIKILEKIARDKVNDNRKREQRKLFVD